jgi:hypothetical protein
MATRAAQTARAARAAQVAQALLSEAELNEMVAGTQAVVAEGLGAGTHPAIVVEGVVYVARFHVIAWGLAGQAATQQGYGMAVIDSAGKVLGWKQ